MIKFAVKLILQLFFWKPKLWRKGLKAKLESKLYSIAIRRKAKSCGRDLYILGPGVNVTAQTIIGDRVGFGKNVKIAGDGPVTLGKRVSIAEGTVIYTQIHDYDHGNDLPFGWNFTYPETRIDDYAWLGLRCIVLPGAHIGEGAIVQAGSVVMGKVPPCAIVAGNPAKIIGYRDFDHYNQLKVALGGEPVEPPSVGVIAPAAPQPSKPAAITGNDRLTAVFTSTFSVTPEEALSMRYKDHPAWDSAGQMALSAAIEREFGVAISPAELYHLRSYADALKLIGLEAKAPLPESDVAPIFDLDRDGIAVIDNGREVSYRELKTLAEDAVRGLKAHTVKLVINDQGLKTVALFVGCVNHGVVPLMVPANMDAKLLENLRSTYDGQPTAKELALLLTTSGSTGSPKLVRISRENLAANCRICAESSPIHPGERVMMVLPICYAFGLSVACSFLFIGGALVFSRYSVMDGELKDQMEAHRVTHFAGVPYMYEILDRFDFFGQPPSALKMLIISGGALAPALRRKYAEWGKARGVCVRETYGQTETTGYMALISTDERLDKIGSIGSVVKGGKFELVENELVYSGPNVTFGYATNAAELLNGDDWQGIRHTGDLAVIDDEGFVTLTGRASRFLKIFGNRVSLDEVENLIKDHFAGVGAAATGADNDLHVFTTSSDLGAVEAFLVSKLHFNTSVMKLHHLEDIPLNPNGKIDYPKLRQLVV